MANIKGAGWQLNICMYKALDGTGSGGEEDSSAAFGFGMTILRDNAEGCPFQHSGTTLKAVPFKPHGRC
jgi:hypothetical protein